MSTIGNEVTLRVWTRVSASNSSSRVPKPPGSTTNPCAYLTNIVLRAKKYRKLIPMSTYWLRPCSNGSSMPRPTETPTGLAGALVGGLHDPWATAGDHGEAGVDERAAEPLASGVLRDLALGARGPEDADRLPELGQRPEALDELGLDAQHPPRVGVHPVARSSRVQQPLVGGGLLHLAAPKRDRPPLALADIGQVAHGRAPAGSGDSGRLVHGPHASGRVTAATGRHGPLG